MTTRHAMLADPDVEQAMALNQLDRTLLDALLGLVGLHRSLPAAVLVLERLHAAGTEDLLADLATWGREHRDQRSDALAVDGPRGERLRRVAGDPRALLLATYEFLLADQTGDCPPAPGELLLEALSLSRVHAARLGGP